jgi:hypothetical protein
MQIKVDSGCLTIRNTVSGIAIFLFFAGFLIFSFWLWKPPAFLHAPIIAFSALFILGGILFMSKEPIRQIVCDRINGILTISEKSLIRQTKVTIPWELISSYQIRSVAAERGKQFYGAISLEIKNSFIEITLYQGLSTERLDKIKDWLDSNGVQPSSVSDDTPVSYFLDEPFRIRCPLWYRSFNLFTSLLIGLNFVWLIHKALIDELGWSILPIIGLILSYAFIGFVLITLFQYLFGYNTLDGNEKGLIFKFHLLGRVLYSNEISFDQIRRMELDLGFADTRSLFIKEKPDELKLQSKKRKTDHNFSEIPLWNVSVSDRFKYLEKIYTK